MNVLVVDDEEATLRYYKAVLGSIPKIERVETATDEEEFRYKVSTKDIHMIICDIHMGMKEGPDILRDSKNLVGSKPVVLLSCSDNLNADYDALLRDNFNMVAKMQKPITPLMLADLLGQ